MKHQNYLSVDDKLKPQSSVPNMNYLIEDNSDSIECILMPVEIAGPLLINEKLYKIPITGSQPYIKSRINRGSLAINKSGGVSALVIEERMFQLYVARFVSAGRAVTAHNWLMDTNNNQQMRELFGRSSHYADLVQIQTKVASKYLFIRFFATVDQSRAQLILEGIKEVLEKFRKYFPDIETLFSANDLSFEDEQPFDVDREIAQQFYVVSEALIHANTVREVLKTTIPKLVDMNMKRNFFANAVTGRLGGLNPEVSAVISGIFLSIGQDLEKAFNSSKCTLITEVRDENKDILHITCTMSSIEIGFMSSDKLTHVHKQCLDALDLGEFPTKQLSQVICGAVMASKLTHLASLSNNQIM